MFSARQTLNSQGASSERYRKVEHYPELKTTPFEKMICCVCGVPVIDHQIPCCMICHDTYPLGVFDVCCGGGNNLVNLNPNVCDDCRRFKNDAFCCYERKKEEYYASR